jgi:hypothetical protein
VRIDWEERTGRTVQDGDFDQLAWLLAERGRAQGGGHYLKHVQEVQRTARAVGRFFADVDVLLTPAAAVPPLPLGSFEGQRGLDSARRCIGFTMLANATGQPAMSVPMTPGDDGLPVGAHFIGRFGDEATLFRLAGQLERAYPWAHRHPPPPSADIAGTDTEPQRPPTTIAMLLARGVPRQSSDAKSRPRTTSCNRSAPPRPPVLRTTRRFVGRVGHGSLLCGDLYGLAAVRA